MHHRSLLHDGKSPHALIYYLHVHTISSAQLRMLATRRITALLHHTAVKVIPEQMRDCIWHQILKSANAVNAAGKSPHGPCMPTSCSWRRRDVGEAPRLREVPAHHLRPQAPSVQPAVEAFVARPSRLDAGHFCVQHTSCLHVPVPSAHIRTRHHTHAQRGGNRIRIFTADVMLASMAAPAIGASLTWGGGGGPV